MIDDVKLSPAQRAVMMSVLHVAQDSEKAKKLIVTIWKTRPVRFEQIMGWLCANKITGDKFVSFVMEENEGSILKFVANVTARLEKSSLRPMFAGRDFHE